MGLKVILTIFVITFVTDKALATSTILYGDRNWGGPSWPMDDVGTGCRNKADTILANLPILSVVLGDLKCVSLHTQINCAGTSYRITYCDEEKKKDTIKTGLYDAYLVLSFSSCTLTAQEEARCRKKLGLTDDSDNNNNNKCDNKKCGSCNSCCSGCGGCGCGC